MPKSIDDKRRASMRFRGSQFASQAPCMHLEGRLVRRGTTKQREIGEADRADEHHARTYFPTRRRLNPAFEEQDRPGGRTGDLVAARGRQPRRPRLVVPVQDGPTNAVKHSFGKFPKEEICWTAMSAALDLLEEFLGAQAPRAARVIRAPSAEQMNRSI